MDKPIEHYWQIRLNDLKEVLEGNHFEVFIAKDTVDAKAIVLDQLLPATGAKSVSWGGSMTYLATGLYEAIKAKPGLDVLDTYDKSLTPEQSYELRRKALLVDLFITGTNAVTEDGLLVNLDMIGNRACAVNFGPKHVILLIGRNKIVGDLEEAMVRVKNYAGPANAMRLDKKTPCVKTSYCEDCKSPDRICNVWTITEKSYPKGRIKIVLINQDLGL